jgi:hypothetical protein
MSYFTFEHDCSNAPITLTIEVEYVIAFSRGDYYTPEETTIDQCKYTLLCAGIDMTKCIMNSNNKKLIGEIEDAVTAAIWQDDENQ